MAIHALLWVAFSLYIGVNFVCALVLHRHAERQAHLPLRAGEVLVHFVLMTAVALPVVLFIAGEALFSRPAETTSMSEVLPVPQVNVRAA